MDVRKKVSMIAGVIWLIFSLGGCATLSFTPPEEKVQERVAAYMQARVDERWGDVYEFLDSGYKEAVSRDQFLGMSSAMDFLAFTIESIDVAPSEEEATAAVKVDVEVKGFTFHDTPEKQTWVKEGRKWYIKVPAKPKTPFE